MPERQDRTSTFEELRLQAEMLIEQQADTATDRPTDILGLIHELKIHQAELQIQNEELQRAQQEISKLHREYESLYEFAPCGYLTLNNKGIITHINLTGSRLLNAARYHVSRVGFSTFIESGWEGPFHSARVRSVKTGQKQSIELPIKRKEELPLWIRLEIEADRDESDAVIQWRMVLIDISEKKKSEETLAKSEARFRKMMESISDPLYVCSPDRRVEYMNPAMIERLNRDATGETCYKTMHGLTEICEWCPFDSVSKGQTIEENIVSPLDDRNYRVTHMPVLNDDRTGSKLTIYRDIQDYISALEDKEKAQAQLHQAQKLESIGNLAGGIAHDFNNILASVLGFTELALEEAERGTVLEENLQEIFIAGNRAKELVRQILTFARKTNEEIRPVQFSKIVRECLKLLRASIPTSIDIKQELNSESLVLGNATLIQQAIMNLATNAMHAMEDNGGVLTIRLADIKMDERTAEKHQLQKSVDYIQLTISDTGVGIPPEAIQSVFEPYYTTKETGKGTGLGLALVHGTVKKYGGTIMVDSHLEHGTEFTIFLPTTEKRETGKPYQSSENPRGTERILLVDDELSIVRMTKRLLENLGYSLASRTSSVEALELFKVKPDDFDLVITDMTMPNLTGDKLAVELIKIRRDIPVILCTGYSKKISEENASEIGIKAFAYKPIVAADLAKIVRKVLDEAKT
jgi:signal transduction histidine kinase/CheY-like chemotaxis protein